MKNVLRDYIYYVKKSRQLDKWYFVLFFCDVIFQIMSPFALVVFPKYILNEIVTTRRINYIVILLICMVNCAGIIWNHCIGYRIYSYIADICWQWNGKCADTKERCRRFGFFKCVLFQYGSVRCALFGHVYCIAVYCIIL